MLLSQENKIYIITIMIIIIIIMKSNSTQGVRRKQRRSANCGDRPRDVFYPLAVASFGTWSIHRLEILKSIARKTSLLHTSTISKAVVITYMNNYK